MKRKIESTFHGLTAEVDVPDHIRPMIVVSWLRENDPDSLKQVCPHDGCCCEIDVLDGDEASCKP